MRSSGMRALGVLGFILRFDVGDIYSRYFSLSLFHFRCHYRRTGQHALFRRRPYRWRYIDVTLDQNIDGFPLMLPPPLPTNYFASDGSNAAMKIFDKGRALVIDFACARRYKKSCCQICYICRYGHFKRAKHHNAPPYQYGRWRSPRNGIKRRLRHEPRHGSTVSLATHFRRFLALDIVRYLHGSI